MASVWSDIGGGGSYGGGTGGSSFAGSYGGGIGSAGGYAAAAGQMVSSVGDYQSSMAGAAQNTAAAARAVVATNIKLRQHERQSFKLQGKAEAAIGQQGWDAGSGSAAAIIRDNAQNLALDHGVIQAQGSELQAKYLAAASADKAGAWAAIEKGVIAAVSIVAAPFTGGASLAIGAAVLGAMK